MRESFRPFVTALFICVVLIAPAVVAQGSIDFSGQQTSPRVFTGGEATVFHVNGTANAPFAVLVSEASTFEVTQYGTLLADPRHQDAFLFLDGFDATHPFYASSSIPSTGSPFTIIVVPFGVNQQGLADHYPMQGLIADPSNPYGLSLTNAVTLEYAVPPPTVTLVDPNFLAPGGQFTVYGSNFSTTPGGTVVRVNDVLCTVVAATETEIVCTLPLQAQSGVITVETAHGITPTSVDSLTTWIVAAPALIVTDQTAPAVITGPTSIIGTVGVGVPRDFTLHVEPGDEVYAELYPWDGTVFRVTTYQNSQTNFIDPLVRIRRFPSLPVTILSDDDSGPQLAAGIGTVGSTVHFVADTSEDLIVQVDTFSSASSGPYLLVVGTRPSTQTPVTVQSIFPNEARPGDVVTIYGSGFDPAQAQTHEVLLNGLSIAPSLVTQGRIEFTVPLNARSGPLNVVAPLGTTAYGGDLVDTFLCVHGFLDMVETEGTIPSVSTGLAMRGSLANGLDTDDVDIDLVAGQSITVEVYALDPFTGRITTSFFLAPSPLDPEIRIVQAGTLGPYLAADQNGGPGLNAMVGGTSPTSAFTAPFTGTFRIRVLAWFSWSSGDYLLVVNPSP